MSREIIKDRKQNVVGYVDKSCHGSRVSDRFNNYKGSYNVKSNITYDRNNNVVGRGNQTYRLF